MDWYNPALLRSLITRHASNRPTPTTLPSHPFFSSLPVSTLNFLDRSNFTAKTREEKISFMKGLMGVLDRFSIGLRTRKILPSLLEEVLWWRFNLGSEMTYSQTRWKTRICYPTSYLTYLPSQMIYPPPSLHVWFFLACVHYSLSRSRHKTCWHYWITSPCFRIRQKRQSSESVSASITLAIQFIITLLRGTSTCLQRTGIRTCSCKN